MKKGVTRALTSRIRRKICPTPKRSQMKLSFGMIFSIFLIIIFISFAIYAIIKFVGLQHVAQIEIFKNDLQADVNKMWQSQQGSQVKKYYLPKKISEVCFEEDESQNLMLISDIPIYWGNIEHINIENSFCITNIEGKVSMTLVKDYGETLVKIIG